jgi:hypothetical protein
MNQVYLETLQWLIRAVFVLSPGFIGAIFGRGPFMVIAAILSLFALNPFASNGPFGLAVICAGIAIVQERIARQEDPND